MTVERDLVADLRLLVVDPGVRDVWDDFSLEIRFDIIAQRNIFAVSQFGVGFRQAFAFALRFLNDLALCIKFRSFDSNRVVAKVGVLEDTADGCGSERQGASRRCLNHCERQGASRRCHNRRYP